MFEYSASNIRACLVKLKPGSLDICSNPNRAIEGQIFEMPFTGRGRGGSQMWRQMWRWMWRQDRKSTRLNCSHRCSSYAVFCLRKNDGSPQNKISNVGTATASFTALTDPPVLHPPSASPSYASVQAAPPPAPAATACDVRNKTR